MATENTIEPEDLIPATTGFIVSAYPNIFTKPGQVRWIMHNRDTNGLNHALVALGPRRLFLSKSRFAEWLAAQTEAA